MSEVIIDREKLKSNIKEEIRLLLNGQRKVLDINHRERYELYNIDENTIKKLGWKIIYFFGISDSVKEIKIHSLYTKNEASLAHYDFYNMIIIFDYISAYRNFTKRVLNKEKYKDLTDGEKAVLKNKPIFAGEVNQRMLITLLHEIRHAFQRSVSMIHSNIHSDPIQSFVYRVSTLRYGELHEKGNDYSKYYKNNPKERDAKIWARLILIDILKDIKEDVLNGKIKDDIADYDEIIERLYREVEVRIYDNYDFNDPLRNNSFNHFMRETNMSNKSFDEIMDTYAEIMDIIKFDQVPEEEISYVNKLILGLPVKRIPNPRELRELLEKRNEKNIEKPRSIQ